MLSYRINRTTNVKRLRANLARISAEQNKTSTADAETSKLTKLIPTEVNSSEFIEALYRCALESGLKQHDVATEAAKSAGAARPGVAASTAIAKHRIKVSASGSYRSFAEYFRRVQNIERLHTITEFKLVPDGDQIKGTVAIELYSLPVKNAK